MKLEEVEKQKEYERKREMEKESRIVECVLDIYAVDFLYYLL